TFDTEERGFEVPIDANKEKQLEGYFNARREAADIALAQVTQEHEIVVAGLMQSTATFPDTAIAGVKWGTKATATPTSDINVAKAAVLDACGMPANKVIMADATWEAFRVCDEVLDRIGSVSSGDPKKISRQVAASILDVDEVVVASARYNSAKEGQTGSLASIWDTDKVFVGYVAPAPRLDNLTVGMNLHWAGDGSEYEWRVEEYWSEEKRCWVIRVRRQAKPVIRAASCGYVLTTVLTKA
ncbi:MAG TPA: hypothetical protein PK280_20810, partial [Planctomycetota bacterium]|nr:hypothetical protein [Planctomycetota bacterium]